MYTCVQFNTLALFPFFSFNLRKILFFLGGCVKTDVCCQNHRHVCHHFAHLFTHLCLVHLSAFPAAFPPQKPQNAAYYKSHFGLHRRSLWGQFGFLRRSREANVARARLARLAWGRRPKAKVENNPQSVDIFQGFLSISVLSCTCDSFLVRVIHKRNI